MKSVCNDNVSCSRKSDVLFASEKLWWFERFVA